MTAIEETREIFSILHDGTIASYTGDKELLSLTINCQYLAERIDNSYDQFYLELTGISLIELEPWLISDEQPTIKFTDLKEIFQAELEISSAEIKDGAVSIACHQTDTVFNYIGGDLIISCESILAFDQNMTPLTIEYLSQICNEYWDEWSRENKISQ